MNLLLFLYNSIQHNTRLDISVTLGQDCREKFLSKQNDGWKNG
jgi:hypothetical protein